MFKEFAFDPTGGSQTRHQIGFWHYTAFLLTVGYIIFGMVLVGMPGISRGGLVMSLGAFSWACIGMLFGFAKVPLQLLVPLLFYVLIIASGFFAPNFPLDYIGRITTGWLAALAIGVFVYNGLSVRVILAGLAVVFLGNMAAYFLGFDAFQINVNEESADSLGTKEVKRFTGLAGQANLLIALIMTLPFMFFLLRRRFNVVVYCLLVGICMAITFITGSRSGIAFTVLFMMFGSLLLIDSNPLRLLALVLGLSLGIVSLYFFSDPQAISRIEQSVVGGWTIVERTILAIDGDFSSEQRANFVEDSWQYFNAKPMLGYGPNMFGIVTGANTYAHNNFVEIMINWGVLGLCLFYASHLLLLGSIVMNPARNFMLVAPLVFLLMADQWFVSFLRRPFVLLLCVMLAVAFTAHDKHRKKRRRKRRRRA